VSHLFLFDIDGVLVNPQGYLKALQDTVAYFTRLIGVGELPPTEQEVRALEAQAITSEWDSAAICISYDLLQRLRCDAPPSLPADWAAAFSALAAAPCQLRRPDYAALAERIGARITPGTGIAEAARAVLWQEALGSEELAPLLPPLAQLLGQLLGHTYDFYRSPVTRRFQHLVVGAQRVQEVYGIDPEVEAASYLEMFDTPLLSKELRLRLHEAAASGLIRAALYTARPSLPPPEAGLSSTGHPPEAEMARSLVELEGYPILGLGSLNWLAAQTGEIVEHLVKPSPVQALAAIGLAACGEQKPALRAAHTLHTKATLEEPLAALRSPTIHVFEDAPSGLAASRRAVDALTQAGLNAELRAYGISPGEGPKHRALQEQGIPAYPSINDALATALNGVGAGDQAAPT
jgi:hypothetical protein